MIRWCCYCQRFLGELPPYDFPAFTHSICKICDGRLERDEPVKADTESVRTLVKDILQCARDGDDQAFAQIIPAASALGLDAEALLMVLLQPALYQAGLDWQGGSMSVAAEHRLSSWCERVFGMLETPPRSSPVELLILQAPGNGHTIGPRFAAHVLATKGVSVEVIVPELPFEEVVRLAQERRPRVVAFSCSMPSQVLLVTALIARLRERLEPGLCCRYVLSGLAFRLGGGTLLPGVGCAKKLRQGERT